MKPPFPCQGCGEPNGVKAVQVMGIGVIDLCPECVHEFNELKDDTKKQMARAILRHPSVVVRT